MSIIFFFEKLLNREDINIKLFGLKYLTELLAIFFGLWAL